LARFEAFFRCFFVVVLPVWRHNWAAPVGRPLR
jgi:hypothetical protein